MKFIVFRDSRDQFRWRLEADDYRIIADSGQGYNSKQHCMEAIELVQNSGDADIVDQTPHREHGGTEERTGYVV
ncbi:MAG: YegP family protein [Desulfomonilaceae bacterium]